MRENADQNNSEYGHVLRSDVKLFVNDTSLFSVFHDVNTFVNNLNNDLNKINDWAIQWKMGFNPNPSK